MSKKTMYLGFAAIVIGLFLFMANRGGSSKEQQIVQPQLELRDTHGIAVAVDNPEKLYIANHSGLASIDSTNKLVAVNTKEADFMSYVVHPSDPNIMYASGHPTTGGNFGFHTSINGGVTWSKVSDGLEGPVDFHTMAIDQENPNNIYGYFRGKLQVSDDAGLTWRFSLNTPEDIIQLSASPEAGVVYATTRSGLYQSKDYGVTWSNIGLEQGVLSLAVNFANPAELVASVPVEGLVRSMDGGDSWDQITTLGTSDIVIYSAFSKDGSRLYVTTENQDIYTSSDNATTWNKYN